MSLDTARALVAGREQFERGLGYEPTLLPLVIPYLDDDDLDQAVYATTLVGKPHPSSGNPLIAAAAARALATRLPSPAEYTRDLPDLILWLPPGDAERLAAATLWDTITIRLAARGDLQIPDSMLPTAVQMFGQRRPAEVALLLPREPDGGREAARYIAAAVEDDRDKAIWLALLVPHAEDPAALAREALAAITTDYPPWHCTYLAALLGAVARLDGAVGGGDLDLPGPFAAHFADLLRRPREVAFEDVPAASHPFGAELAELLDGLSIGDRALIAGEVVAGILGHWGGVTMAEPPSGAEGTAGDAGAEWAPPPSVAPDEPLPPPAAPSRPSVAPDEPLPPPAAPSRPSVAPDEPLPPPAALSPRTVARDEPQPRPAAPALPVDTPVAPAVTARSLRADVSIPAWPGGGRIVSRSFAQGQLHRLELWIGHDADARSTTVTGGRLREEAVMPEGKFSELDITVAHKDVTQTKSLYLPTDRSKSSKPVEFDLRVGAGQHNVGANVVVSQGGRVLQQSVLRGAVSEQPDGFAEGRIELETEVLARTAETVDPERSRQFDVAVANPGAGAPAVVLKDGTATIPSTWTEAVRGSVDIIAEELFNTARVLAAADDTASWDGLLRLVAAQGHLLHGWMMGNGYGALQDAERIQLTDADPTEVMPVEFVYDRGSVASDATACPGWAEALETGSCPHCDPAGGEQQPYVCSLGFWGLRKLIERQTGTGEGRPPGRLRPMRSVVFAASGQVLDDDYEATRQTLADVLGVDPVEIDSWTRWNEVAEAAKPTLVVVLPHQGFDEAVQRDYLEIGASSRLPAGDVRYRVIKTEEEGPIVLLLGCKTADATLRYRNFAAEFRSGGASIVVATLATVLGRNAAPLAQQFVREMAAIGPAGSGFGEVMRSVRRKMVAQRNPAALGLVSFGDSDWVLG